MFTCMSSLQRCGRLASMPVSCHCAASLPGAAALHSRSDPSLCTCHRVLASPGSSSSRDCAQCAL